MKGHFGAVLDMRLVERRDGIAVHEVDLREELCNVHGTAHGGVIMAMLDATGLWADMPAGGRAETPPNGATVSVTCNFLRAAKLDQTRILRASGQVTRRGGTLYFATMEVRGLPGGELLATGQGVYAGRSAPDARSDSKRES